VTTREALEGAANPAAGATESARADRRASRAHRSDDPVFSDPGWSGELLAARVRILVVALLLSIRFASWEPNVQILGVVINGVGLIYALLWWLFVRRAFRPWMGYASAFVDVSIITSVLVGLVLVGRPDAAMNTRLTYDVYLLAIGVSALRFNWRISAFTTATAFAQFLAIHAWVAARGELGFSSPTYGSYNPAVETGRALMILIAGVLSIALIRRTQSLLRLSSTDWLTDIANRGVFDAKLRDLVARSDRRPFVVALIDLDHFKQFNDRHGHAAGDGALREAARALQARVRGDDVLARVGGEEFGVILRGATMADAMTRLDDLRRVIEGVRVPTASGDQPLSTSIGAAAFPADGSTEPVLREVADRRLYEAKARGRNRVVGS
jgi:diguanylate cyclase (GGDEF)-like protein